MSIDGRYTGDGAHRHPVFFENDDDHIIPAVTLVGGASAYADRPEGTDFDLDVARGAISGYSRVQKFGHNTNVLTSGTGADIWSAGGDYTGFIQAALPVRIKAGGSAADDSGGLGAQSVTVSGVDETWTEVTETIVTNGSTVSLPTATSFIRINRAWVAGVGAYGVANTGAIVIENTTPVVMAEIEALEGQSQMAITHVPAGKTAYLTAIRIFVGGGSSKTATVSLYKRENADTTSAPFGPKRLVQSFDVLHGGSEFATEFRSYNSFPAKTDIWVRGISQTTAQAVNCTFDYFLVSD